MSIRQPIVRSRKTAASPIPLVVGLAAVVISVVLAVVIAGTVSVPIRFVGIALPIVRSDSFALSLIGYLLTPIVTVVAAGWDRIAQRSATAKSGNFIPNRGYETALTWTAGISIVVGAWHILNLSVPLSELWGIGR